MTIRDWISRGRMVYPARLLFSGPGILGRDCCKYKLAFKRKDMQHCKNLCRRGDFSPKNTRSVGASIASAAAPRFQEEIEKSWRKDVAIWCDYALSLSSLYGNSGLLLLVRLVQVSSGPVQHLCLERIDSENVRM